MNDTQPPSDQPPSTGPASTRPGAELPYGQQTIEEFRLARAAWATRLTAQRAAVFAATFTADGVKPSLEQLRRFEELAETSANAWSVVAAIEWVRRRHGTEAAYLLTALIQHIGINGDPWDETLLHVEGLSEAPDPLAKLDTAADAVAARHQGEPAAGHPAVACVLRGEPDPDLR